MESAHLMKTVSVSATVLVESIMSAVEMVFVSVSLTMRSIATGMKFGSMTSTTVIWTESSGVAPIDAAMVSV